MTISTQEAFLDSVRDVDQQVEMLGRRYFKQGDVVGIDYLSVFTTESTQYEEWCVAAASLGARVAEKRGGIFRINEGAIRGLLSSIVRISEPGDASLRGCGDIIPANFEIARDILLDAGFQEKPKSLNGQDYTIIEVTDYEVGVSLYLPSVRMTDIMGIAE